MKSVRLLLMYQWCEFEIVDIDLMNICATVIVSFYNKQTVCAEICDGVWPLRSVVQHAFRQTPTTPPRLTQSYQSAC
jgi:hypothetical protein